MFKFLKNLFSVAPVEDVDFKNLVKNGAVILDVRTLNEYKSGNIKKSKNIPVQIIKQKIDIIKKYNKPVIAYCRSGQRSGLATKIMKSNGIEAYNGGAYSSLSQILR